MKYRAIIFDLDGTLLNTLDDLTDSVNFTLETLGYPARTLDEIRSFVGDGFGNLIAQSIPGGADNEHYEEALDIFKKHYEKFCNVKTGPYDGIPELLSELESRGYKFGVVSNKGDAAVKELIFQHFAPVITVAIGARPGVRRKPAPDTVFAALEELGESPEDAVYVGDSEYDLLTAKEAGMDCIAVSWGFRGRARLEELGAETIADIPADMLDMV